MNALKKNKLYSEKYIQKVIPHKKIPSIIKDAVEKSKKIIDLGCGEGQIIHSLKSENKKVTGIDISPRRIAKLKLRFPKDKFKCIDICNTKLKKESYDLIISTQVIEHLKNDKKFVEEAYRLLKPKKNLYITSVIKKPYAIYKYRNKGKFVLDPTHEKEYKNPKEFLDLFRDKFNLIKYKVYRVKRKILGIHVIIPGYYIIEGLWEKK